MTPLHSTDFDHQLSMVQAQLHALMESVNKLSELKAKMKTGAFEKPLSRQELAEAMGRDVWTIDWWARKKLIKGHRMGRSRVYYLSEVQDAIKKS